MKSYKDLEIYKLSYELAIRIHKMLKRRLLKVAAVFLLAFLIMLAVLHLAGCEESSNQIGGPFAISPDDEKIAMTIGPDWRHSRPYVLELNNGSSQLIPVQRANLTQGMAWRPGASPPELLVLTSSSEEPQRVVLIRVSDGVTSTVSSWDVPANLIMYDPVWNPSGKILAVTVGKISKGTVKGIYLGISYDNGKSFTITDIPGKSSVWTNNETLYLHNGNDILEVEVSNKMAKVRKTLVSAEGVWLVGALKGEIVYIQGNDIYQGGQLLYHLNQKIRMCRVDGSYLAFKVARGGDVVVLDDKGNVINKKSVGNDTTKLVALSSANKFVYLMKNEQSIERYSFVDDDEISTVFDVGILK